MAIYCNTLEHNTQYGIDPYCFTPTTYVSIASYTYTEYIYEIMNIAQTVAIELIH